MNFGFKYRFSFFLSGIIFSLGLCCLYAQEIPPIQKFSPNDYHGDNQNWMISQAPNKFIYVANNEGLLEYNGADWKLYPSPNATIVRAVKALGNRIYTGCYMEFGYWEPNVFGTLEYQSIVANFQDTMIADEHVWNIITYEDWVLFQTFNRIYFYNPTSGETSILNSGKGISRVFNVSNSIYFHVTDEGIYKIVSGEPQLVVDDTAFVNDKVVGMFLVNNKLLIQTKASGFYTLQGEELKEWGIPAQRQLREMDVFNSIQLKDNSFIIGTIKSGIVYVNADGEVEYVLNRANGLSNNTALAVFEDVDENIWVGLDNGINCINITSPIRVFNDDKGTLGTVYATAVFNDYLYLGTNQGLFYKKAYSSDPFTFVEGTSGQVWSLYAYDDTLFCGHHLGTFTVSKSGIEQVSSIPGTWGFRTLTTNDSILLQGNYNGMHVLHKTNGKWRYKNKIEGFENSARYFEVPSGNTVWVSHGYKGVFSFQLDETLTQAREVRIDTTIPADKNSSLATFKDRMLYAYEGGVLQYNTIINKFELDSLLSSTLLKPNYLSGKLVDDGDGKLWSFSEDNLSYVYVNDVTSEFKVNRIALPYYLRKGQIGYENISKLYDDNYIIGVTDGYLTLDISHVQKSNPKIVLNSIRLNSLDDNSSAVSLQSPGSFAYQNNTVSFHYSVPNYNKFHQVHYQYKLDGRFNKWSEWSDKSTLLFENLDFGTYNLKIRAKIGNEITTNTLNYSFTINRPWFLSNTALLCYLALLVLVSVSTHKAYKRHYKKVHFNKQLKSDQLIVKITNEKLNQEIDSKNRELAISTMSIIKKNEVLHSIKKELNKSKQDKSITTAVKLIDDNLNDKKDWSFFEKAFNNADKDFLDKIKKAHPDLSSNDLRFCAYLRLNLSSKEMAPLLNISTKSVETKRYRLRKKLGLEHDSGLIDYILNFK